MSPSDILVPAPSTVSTLDPLSAAAAFVPFDGVLYLDCAAQAPRLRSVLADGHAALDAGATPWHLPFDALEAGMEALRDDVARVLFDGDSDGVAAIPSAAYGVATAARNLDLDAGDTVLVLDGQFPSNLMPWQQRCRERGGRLLAVQCSGEQDWTEAVLAVLEREPRVRIVALPHARWDDGALLDLDRIAPHVHAAGAALVLDLSQSLGVLPTDLARWRPDFVVSVGYKWLLGPIGLAWLWAAPRWREDGIAIEQHWSARDAGEGWRFPIATAPPYRAGARRFDAGGFADPVRLAMARAGLAQVQAWGVALIAAALGERMRVFDEALDTHGLSHWKTPGHAPHLASLRPPPSGIDAVFEAFRRERIVCTRRYGLLRIAPHLHVGAEDLRRVAGIVARAAQAG